ncbi:MAG: hypothetical protein MI749_05745 [Desulfovibrionales bacterium]|nr:hypothetical protein [Desulfovibrionales bacterium]
MLRVGAAIAGLRRSLVVVRRGAGVTSTPSCRSPTVRSQSVSVRQAI